MKSLCITLYIAGGAVFLPPAVLGQLPPPPGMDPLHAMAFVLWLAFVGGLAGYGMYKV